MKYSPIYLQKSLKDLLGEQQKRMSSNLPSETSHSNQEEAPSPLTSEKLTNDMQQIKSQLDFNRAENSSLLPVKEETKQVSCDLQKRESSDTRHDILGSHEEERTLSCKNENDSDILMQKPRPSLWTPAQESKLPPVSHLINDQKAVIMIPKDEPHNGQSPASQSDKQELTYSARPEKALEKLQPRRNPDTGGCSSQSDQVTIPLNVSGKFSVIPKEEPHPSSLQPRQSLNARNHELAIKEEKCYSVKSEKASENLISISSSSIGVPVTQPDQENFQLSVRFEKVEKLQPRRNPDPIIQGLQSDAESTPSRVLEKGLDDGYNWRKYGQKLVKGNTFIRSYYKCTYPNCQAKKQVEKSHDGCKMDVNYLGNHHHSKPQHSPQVNSAFQVRISDIPIVPASQTDAEPIVDHIGANPLGAPTETLLLSTVASNADGVIEAVSCSNNDNNDKDAKRQKREITSADDNVVNKPNSDLRNVVQTLSEVDIVNDGYRWRKYGQKLVKGNPNPRSYYRCSKAGCPVKKHVERASHDPKLVITTYEGQHDHDMPPSRSVSQSAARSDANIMTSNGESRQKPEENNPVALDMVVHVSSN